MPQHSPGMATPSDHSVIWASASASMPTTLDRPHDVPRPESVDEISRWAGSEDLRRTELVYAPVFWVFLPLAVIGFLIYQMITDPTSAGWSITANGASRDTWLAWVPWLAWIGVTVWLLIAVGVLLLRLSALRDLRVENAWVYGHGVAHSIHRACIDYDDGEARWATYIALDHRLDDGQAATIHAAFELWLFQAGLPPSGSKPISSETLFGEQAQGGYFILHLPVSTTAGETTAHKWLLITQPQDDERDVIVTPVPIPKKLAKIRRTLHRKAARRSAS
ncbi:Uncharacterised protein [Mycobacteroides abscessus subsp. bolletii]|nr:Uncharacterised protein [Mycobacteroides abscessus subsp. bolletii]SKP87523.1 Uncharacterised protein [Mycobacteroides abscessus subsp. bolletii]SKQ37953.1 Uncharacterised protein [Mycobacteroides abscessus subsp. bolletii]SKQ53052.1 Uncharacterised protein [Mycobacteroides abscessus subsp. bolletii]